MSFVTRIDTTSLEIPDMAGSLKRAERIEHPEAWNDNEAQLIMKNAQRKSCRPWSSGSNLWANFRHFVRAGLMEFSMSFVLAFVVPTVVSLVAGETIAMSTLTIAISQFLVFYLLMGLRHSYRLPVSMGPGMWFSAWLHDHVGIWIMLAMIGMNYAGSALGAPLLAATGGSAVPNFAAAFRPVSTAGAYLLSLMASTFIHWAYLHQQPMDIHTTRYNVEEETKVVGLERVNLARAGAHSVMTLALYPNGLYTHGNVVMYLGAAINNGFDVPAGSNFWASELFVSPAGGALLGWVLHLLSWNVNGLSADDFAVYSANQEAARQSKKEIAARYLSSKDE